MKCRTETGHGCILPFAFSTVFLCLSEERETPIIELAADFHLPLFNSVAWQRQSILSLQAFSSALELDFHNSRKLKPKPTIKGLTFIQDESFHWRSATGLKLPIITFGCSNLQCSSWRISWCCQTCHFLEPLMSVLMLPWSCWLILTDSEV